MDFIEVSAKTVDDAITESLVKLGTTSDKIEYEVIEKGSSGFLGIGSRPAVIKVRKKSDIEDYVNDFLCSVFQAMGMQVEILINKSEDGKIVDVELKGEEMGVLIGKRGQTLDSLQYLTNLAVGKQITEYVKVKIDKRMNFPKKNTKGLYSQTLSIYQWYGCGLRATVPMIQNGT